MSIRRARLVDAPALAWTAALAFAAETGHRALARRAAGKYLMYLAMLLPLILAGTVWHLERQAVVSIAPRKNPAPALVTGFALIITAYVAFLAWLPNAGLPALLIVEVGMVVLVLLGFAVVVPALPDLAKTRRRSANARAIHAWAHNSQCGPIYMVSLLAKRPDAGTIGVSFAARAIEIAVAPGSRVVTEARTEKHAKIYEAKGFVRLMDAGTPTLAMAADV